jgi:hypothetical protein
MNRPVVRPGQDFPLVDDNRPHGNLVFLEAAPRLTHGTPHEVFVSDNRVGGRLRDVHTRILACQRIAGVSSLAREMESERGQLE